MRSLSIIHRSGLVLALVLSGCASPAPERRERPLLGAQPIYPAAAAMEGRAGWARLDCTITTAGATKDCRVTEASAPDFAASALDFVRRARYQPATRHGIAVEQQHHLFTINYALPPQAIRRNIVCGVLASGKVHDCRFPPDIAPSASENWVRNILELATVSPSIRNGQPVDDPDRAMAVQIVIAPLPTPEPMPPVSGDIVTRLFIACHPASGPQKRCVIDKPGSEGLEVADTSRFQIVMALSGAAPPQTSDFSE